MYSANQNPKLELKKEVIIKFNTIKKNRGVNEQERRNFTCCDGFSYASTPYRN